MVEKHQSSHGYRILSYRTSKLPLSLSSEVRLNDKIDCTAAVLSPRRLSLWTELASLFLLIPPTRSSYLISVFSVVLVPFCFSYHIPYDFVAVHYYILPYCTEISSVPISCETNCELRVTTKRGTVNTKLS